MISRSTLAAVALAAVCAAGSARGAQQAAGFPKKLPGLVNSPLATGPGADGLPQLYLGNGNELHCLTLQGHGCPGFPVFLGEKVQLAGAPAIGDLDGDRRAEIVAALSDGRIAAWRLEGAPLDGFAFHAEAGLSAGPSLLELDGDGRLEVVAGDKAGKLHALRASGARVAGFPISLGQEITSRASAGLFGLPARLALAVGNEDGRVYLRALGGAALPGSPFPTQYMVSGQPAVGDLDGDGANDLAFASQDFKVYAVRGDGKPFAGYPVALAARLLTGPALGDLDGDGRLEVVVAATDGRLHALDLAGKPLPGFPVRLGERLAGAAVIADLDRDGKDELLAASADGQLHVLRANGKPYPGFPARLQGEATAGPVVVDAGDGHALIAQGAGEKVFAFKVKRVGKAAGPFTWPEPGHDGAHSGRVHPNPPGYADLAVAPGTPATDDTLSAGYRFFDLDGDPEPATALRWLRDGKDVPELAGKLTVPPQLTRKKERWRFEVGAPGLAPRPSGEVTIANSRPGKARLAFEPAVLRRAEPVRVRLLAEAPDADGDKLRYSYLWLKNGLPQKGLSSAELPAGTLKKGERWVAVVVANDGEAEGPPATLEAIVEDSAPGAPEVALSPASPRTGEAVRAVIKRPASDVDGDVLRYRYRFFVDGVPMGLASGVDVLPPMTARKKQVVSVEVQADDGELLGPTAAAKAGVVNTPPSAPAPALVPHEPRHGEVLAAGLAAASQDPDGDKLTYRFAILKDGKRVSTSADGREAGGLRRGETYTVEVVANDGEADSPAGKASVQVRNSLPTRPALAFQALPLRRVDAVRVRVAEPSIDADGDAVTYAWTWARDGQVQKAFTGPELPAGTVRKGERWTVTATPSDGRETGPAASLEAVAVDSAPTAPKVALRPDSPRITEALEAVVLEEAADVDGDKLRYRYQFAVDGVALALDPSARLVPAGTVRKGQTLTVQVQADDGELLGPVAGAKVAVVNTPPEAPLVTLLPREPRRGDLLQGGLAGQARDADGDLLTYRFAFLRDGKKVPSTGDGRELAGARAGETYVLEVVASDGQADSPPARASVTVLNAAPSAPAVSFTQAAPRSGEAVEVRIDRPSLDADGEQLSYEYAFFVGGKPAGLPKEARAIPAGRLKKHEVWTVRVTPSDGRERGPVGLARLEVVNTPPSAPKVALDPAEPTADSGARARLAEPAADHDADPLSYRYAWYRNGVRLDLPRDAASVPPGVLRRGDAVALTVTAFDGEVEGPGAAASARVKNSPPAAPKLALQPAQPTVTAGLHCAVVAPATDPDREAPKLRFTWRRNGEPVPMAAEQDRLAAGAARRGESWSCEAVATDGELTSAPARAETRILDSAPTAPQAVVEPEKPRAGEDLHCRLARAAEDADGDAVTYAFRWTQGGKPLNSKPQEPWVLPAALVRKGAAYRCEVTASDGELRGPGANAEGRYRNSPPGRAAARIAPDAPKAGAPLTCQVSAAATDPDGDKVRYRYLWRKNGVEQSFADSSAQVPGRLVKGGDLWRCTLIPTDGEDDGPEALSEEVVVEAPATASR